MADTTVLLPVKRKASEKEEGWLKEAIASLPKGTPYLVLRNDGEYTEALNEGVKAAKTPYYIAMGADDKLGPDCIAHLEGPAWNADVVYPSMPLMNEEGQLLDLHEAVPFCPMRLQEMNYISGGSLVRREKALEVGGYRNLGALEDWDLWVRIFRAGGRLKPCPQAQYHYRLVDGSMNSRVREDADFRNELRKKIVGEPDPVDSVRATFYPQATAAVTYLRAQLPARYLPGLVRGPHEITVMQDPDGNLLFPEQVGDAAVFLHPGDKTRAATLALFKSAGIRTLIEVDDNYLINPGKAILKKSQWGLKIGDALATRQGHTWIAKTADGIIATTRALADAYRKVNENVYICPNTVDPVDWPEPEKPDDGILRIAWIASFSHKPDLPLITRAFEWASRQKDVEVYASSAVEPAWKFDHGLIPWADDLDLYRKFFSHFDVAVCPIKATPFSIYRSDVKALEGAMGGCALVLSDVPPYEDWTEDRCMKAKDAKGFYHAIKHLVQNRDEVKRLAQAARDYTLKERTTEAQVHLWEQALADQ